jgi:hypothetical protein
MVKSGFSPHMLVETEESMKRIQVILQDDDEMLSDLNDPVLLASNLESKVAPSATVCYMKGLALPNNAVATESIKSLQFVTEE